MLLLLLDRRGQPDLVTIAMPNPLSVQAQQDAVASLGENPSQCRKFAKVHKRTAKGK